MTHAALKDLVKKWREEAAEARASGTRAQKRGNQDYAEVLWQAGNDAEAYADELSAALSAMEGEAAVEILGWNDNASPRLRFLTKVGRLTAGTILYTAPPPQQAEPDYTFPAEVAKWFGVAHDYPHSLRAATDERDELLRDYVKLAKALGFKQYTDFDNVLTAATHPTPSPGPQRNEYHWGWLIDGVPFAGAGCSDKTAIALFARPNSPGPQGGGGTK